MTDALLDPRQIAARLGLLNLDGKYDEAALFAYLRALPTSEEAGA